MRRRLLTRVLPSGLTVVFVALLWLTLAPPQLGGRTVMAVAYGTSMEPKLHRGDVLILRRGGPAKVGDVVGYQSPVLNRLVVHRVHRIEDGKLIFKGDNNDFLDPGLVPQSAVQGHLVVHVPRGGFAVEQLRKPQSAAGLGVLAAFFLVGGGAAKRRRRGPAEPEPEGVGPGRLLIWLPRLRTAVAGVAFVAGALAALGFLHATTLVSRTPLYQQTGSFAYTASAHAEVYGGRSARTGDPVFLKASGPLDVSFASRLEGAKLARSASLTAEVESTSGWHRSIPLAPATALPVGRSTISGSLDLRALRHMLDLLELRTGVIGSPYTIRVRAKVRLLGATGGAVIRDTWTPTLRLTLDGTTVKPYDTTFVQTAAKTTPTVVPARLELGVASPSVSVVRAGGLTAALAALALFGLLLLVERRTHRPGEAAEIERRLGQSLVTVDSIEVSDVTTVVELGSIDELIKLAQEYERLVLHQQRGSEHAYTVVEDRVLYRYLLRPEPALRAVEVAA